MLMRVNIKIFHLKEVWHPSYPTHPKWFSSHIYNRFKFQTKQNFMHFLRSSAIERLKPAPTQDKVLDFLQNEFSHSKCFQKAFFHLNGGQALCAWACPDGHAPQFNEKMLFGNILGVKIHFVKSQGIYLESGLVSAFNGWTSQKMHEILLCLKFEAVVDVIWKLFWVCLITWIRG